MRLLTTVCSFLIAAPILGIKRGTGTDGDEGDHDVVSDLGQDLAARILKEREQLKRQNKELRQQLSVAQHFADQRAAMLQAQNRAEHDKISNLQKSLNSVQSSLKQAQTVESNLQQMLHNKGVAPLPLPPQLAHSSRAPAPRHHRPVTSLQQAGSEKPSHQRSQKPKLNSKKVSHHKVSKAALTAIRTKLASATYARKKEVARLASLTNKSQVLETTYARETATLKAEINQSNTLLATVKQNDKLLEEIRTRYNKTSMDVLRTKQRLSWTKQQIERLQQMHKQDTSSLKDLNQTTSKLRGQLNKLNESLVKVQQKTKHDEEVQANKTKQMKATLDKKLNALNHTDEEYSKKIANARNASAKDADKTDELHRMSKRLENQVRETRWETRQQKEHIADLTKLVNELEHNFTLAKKAEKAEEIHNHNETQRMQNGASKRIKELTKMVADTKKKITKWKADELSQEKKVEAKDNSTLKDDFSKIQKLKNNIKAKLKVVADSEKEVHKDQKAARDTRNAIASLRDTINEDHQKVATLEAYLGNEKNDLSDVKAQLHAVQNATKKESKREAKAEADLQAKVEKQKKALETAESKVKAKLKEEKDALEKIKKDESIKAAAKEKLVKAEAEADKKLQLDVQKEYKKGNQTMKEEAMKQQKRLSDEKALEAKEAKDKADMATEEKKEQELSSTAAKDAQAEASKQKAKEQAEANVTKEVTELKQEKESLRKEVKAMEGAPKMEAASATLRAQIAASKSSFAAQDKALEAAQEKQKREDKALQQQQTSLAAIQAQFQQAAASLAAAQQSAQATEAGATESWQRVSQATAERDQMAQQLRSVSAASLPWIQAEAKAQAQVKQLRGKLHKVEQDDGKHKAMLSKLLVFSRSQKSKLKALLSVMTPAQRKHLHL